VREGRPRDKQKKVKQIPQSGQKNLVKVSLSETFTKFQTLKMQIKLFTIPINEIESYNEELNKFLRTHKIIEVDFQCIPMLVHPSKKKKWLREGITLGNNKQNQSHLSQVGANPPR
jgi:hypothetical protein